MPAARKEMFQAAILDINVKGEMIYGLADAIAARDIPLVFVTGYGAETVEERFRTVPVLQKPVDRTALERVLVSRKIGGKRYGEVSAAAGEPHA
jgi:DNA-binding LytR/AlgR family response regulator